MIAQECHHEFASKDIMCPSVGAPGRIVECLHCTDRFQIWLDHFMHDQFVLRITVVGKISNVEISGTVSPKAPYDLDAECKCKIGITNRQCNYHRQAP